MRTPAESAGKRTAERQAREAAQERLLAETSELATIAESAAGSADEVSGIEPTSVAGAVNRDLAPPRARGGEAGDGARPNTCRLLTPKSPTPTSFGQ